MILEVDIGNTRIKWRFRDEMVVLVDGSMDRCERSGFAQIQLPAKPKQIFVASVVSGELFAFRHWCEESYGMVPTVAKVSRVCAGVENAYNNVDEMGVDRWLAIVAAYNKFQQSCLVVDAGSACTVDLVANTGKHLGGYIVPGIRLMSDALYRETDRVKPRVQVHCPGVKPGCSTQAAVASGLLLMLLGLVVQSFEDLIKDCSNVEPVVIFTGGNGQQLAVLLENYLEGKADSVCVDYCPDLVLSGLPFVCI